jgi:hypothetical protein
VLPANATAWPTINFFGDFDAPVNLLEEVDYFWLK